jgi:hypothetical protein
VLHVALQRVDNLPGAAWLEADHIDHYVGLEIAHPSPKDPLGLLCHSIDCDLRHGTPGSVRLVRLSDSPTDRGDVVACFHQARNQIRADVPAAPNQDDMHRAPLLCLRTFACIVSSAPVYTTRLRYAVSYQLMNVGG